MQGSHTVQPRLPQLWRVTVVLGQTVVEVHQLLWVILVGLGKEEGGEGREGERWSDGGRGRMERGKEERREREDGREGGRVGEKQVGREGEGKEGEERKGEREGERSKGGGKERGKHHCYSFQRELLSLSSLLPNLHLRGGVEHILQSPGQLCDLSRERGALWGRREVGVEGEGRRER